MLSDADVEPLYVSTEAAYSIGIGAMAAFIVPAVTTLEGIAPALEGPVGILASTLVAFVGGAVTTGLKAYVDGRDDYVYAGLKGGAYTAIGAAAGGLLGKLAGGLTAALRGANATGQLTKTPQYLGTFAFATAGRALATLGSSLFGYLPTHTIGAAPVTPDQCGPPDGTNPFISENIAPFPEGMATLQCPWMKGLGYPREFNIANQTEYLHASWVPKLLSRIFELYPENGIIPPPPQYDEHIFGSIDDEIKNGVGLYASRHKDALATLRETLTAWVSTDKDLEKSLTAYHTSSILTTARPDINTGCIAISKSAARIPLYEPHQGAKDRHALMYLDEAVQDVQGHLQAALQGAKKSARSIRMALSTPTPRAPVSLEAAPTRPSPWNRTQTNDRQPVFAGAGIA